jgi:non-heme chloroperoxidase
VLPLPISALKSGSPVLRNPANRNRAVPLTYEQFAVPTPGKPLFQAASANLNPWTEAKVDTHNPDRGPLLIISGEQDHTVPWAIANASFQQQQANPGVTEIVEIKGRGHALTIDSGWREVADTALAFVQRFTS